MIPNSVPYSILFHAIWSVNTHTLNNPRQAYIVTDQPLQLVLVILLDMQFVLVIILDMQLVLMILRHAFALDLHAFSASQPSALIELSIIHFTMTDVSCIKGSLSSHFHPLRELKLLSFQSVSTSTTLPASTMKLLVVCLVLMGALLLPVRAGMSGAQEKEILDEHNAKRDEVGHSEPHLVNNL